MLETSLIRRGSASVSIFLDVRDCPSDSEIELREALEGILELGGLDDVSFRPLSELLDSNFFKGSRESLKDVRVRLRSTFGFSGVERSL